VKKIICTFKKLSACADLVQSSRRLTGMKPRQCTSHTTVRSDHEYGGSLNK